MPAENCAEVTLYALHPGLWLPEPSSIRFMTYDQIPTPAPIDAKTYYAVNRSYLIQKVVPIPTIEPDFTIEHCGNVMAWIYCADRLRDSGFELQK